MRLRKDDTVLVIKGKDRGKQGRVQQVYSQEGKVSVESVNVVKRHTKATGGARQAGIIQKEMPIQVSNVMLVCTHCLRPTRTSSRALVDGSKARACKLCQEVIE